MTAEQMKKVDSNFKEFADHLKNELEKNGTVTCESPNCNCEKKEKLPAGKFHVFMDPKEFKCYAVCNLGLMRLSHEYGFWHRISGSMIDNQ